MHPLMDAGSPFKEITMSEIIGIGLAAGQGARCRPLTLKTHGYIRAKAAVRFLGHRVLEWLLHSLQMQGVEDVLMITLGKENRCQVKSIAGYGDQYALRMRYSPISLEHENSGSADALLANLDYFDVQRTALVFPTDSVLDVNLPAMIQAHQRTGAAVTIASARQTPEHIAHRYGLIDCAENHRVSGFLEKPSLEDIALRYRGNEGMRTPPALLDTNAGFYLMDPFVLRAIALHPAIQTLRASYFDLGKDLLPWLVEHRYPVYTFPVNRMGDLGNIPSLLETLGDVLHGHYPAMTPLLGTEIPTGTGMFIDPTSLSMSDPLSGLPLHVKMSNGMVTLHPPLRIGRYVRIYPGAHLAECNIDDECEIHEHVTIRRSSVGEGSCIGAFAHLEDTVTGMMVEMHSEKAAPVSLSHFTALGDSVSVGQGVTLTDHITVYPQITIPAFTYRNGQCQIDEPSTQYSRLQMSLPLGSRDA
jgi:NDP-sugar pyrophosphorylase family protein